MCEPLEQRTLFSFVYEDIGALSSLSDPREFGADGYYGPMAVLDDVDEDGVRDVLIGNAGTYTAGRSGFYLRGAAVFSGATGTLLRTHNEIGEEDDRYGWRVDNVGDVDDDGVADYGISNGGFLYSGATGSLIRRYGGNITGAGDVNQDGLADLLVISETEQRAFVYSGGSETVIREFAPSDAPNSLDFGEYIHGGIDLNTDGIPDAIIHSRINTGEGFPDTRIWAFSGADGSILWTADRSNDIDYFLVFSGASNLVADLTGDNVADLVLTAVDQLTILSGADGSVARVLTPSEGSTLGKIVATYGDLDQDGTPDLAVGVRAALNNGSRVFVVSGATGEVLSDLGFLGGPPPIFGPAPSFEAPLAVVDIDNDGANDILAIYQRFGSFGIGGFSRTFVFDGTLLGGTTITGSGSGTVSRSILWGNNSSNAFIVRDGVVAFLEGRESWNDGEVIIDVYESGTEIIILGGATADGLNPFVWIADHTLTSVRRVDVLSLIPAGAPAPPAPLAIEWQGIAVAGHHLLVQRTVVEPGLISSWLVDADQGTMFEIFAGVPVDLAVDQAGVLTALFGLQTDDPPNAYVFRAGEVSSFAGRPIALSPRGDYAVSLSMTDGGGQEIHQIDLSSDTHTSRSIPAISTGEDFLPAGINDFGEISGSYTFTATGERSGFYYSPRADRMFDLRADDVFGDPDDFSSSTLSMVLAPSNAGDVLVRWGTHSALLTIAAQAGSEGPIRAANDATLALAFTPAGDVYVITHNAAGEVLYLARGAAGWTGLDLSERSIFTGMQMRQIVTWYDEGDANPTIVLARPEGVILLEAGADAEGGWTIRNLTEEIEGAEAIVDGLLTMLPQNGLRLVAGLNAEGELMLYGQTAASNDGQQQWAFDNLFDSVVYPTGTPPPRFREYTGVANLVGYVTGWGGQNIAGIAGGGQIVVFWTAPGISGWRVANLAQVSDGSGVAGSYYRSLHVELTPWNGINLYGENVFGNAVQVTWWVPQFGGRWRADMLIEHDDTKQYPQGTLTAYATPWGGLNVARVNPDGAIEVFWWSAAAGQWTLEVLNPQVSSHLADVRAVGRLFSAVSENGEINIFARNELGDVFRFFWDPQHPWQLERV